MVVLGPRRWASALVVVAALAGCGGGDDDDAGCREGVDGLVASYTATAPAGGPPTSEAVDHAVQVMCDRAAALGVEADIQRRGADRIEVRIGADRRRQLDEIAASRQLGFYDWEPNVSGDPSVPLNDLGEAVRTAARAKPRAEEADVPPAGPSRDVERRLGGDAGRIRRHYDRQNDIVVPPPPGARPSQIPRGIAIVKEQPPAGATDNTPAQYYVIENDAELSGADIRNPAQGFDKLTQEPILTVEFGERGKQAFARVTRRVAERGQETLPEPGQSPAERFQHFMIALDGQIVSLATIDFIANPEGISASRGAQINGLGSIEDTKALAATLRLGPLPVRLERER